MEVAFSTASVTLGKYALHFPNHACGMTETDEVLMGVLLGIWAGEWLMIKRLIVDYNRY